MSEECNYERLEVETNSDRATGRTRSITVTDPKTNESETYEISEFAQSMNVNHLIEKAREWFVEDYGDAA